MTRRTLWLALAGLVVAAVAVGIVLRWADRPAPLPVFEEERAYALVSEQTDFGPRVPGTAAHDSARVWLQARLGVYADRVVEQQIEIPDPADTTRTFRGTNIVASWQPGLRRRILLAAHWDSRPIADNDPDPARRLEPVHGANDGASGVAVLLEIARLLDAQPLQRPVGVDIILFDLEDLGTIDPAVPEGDRVPFAMGSEMFVLHNPGYRPVWGVLLDMVGDTDLRIPKEGYSVQHAPELVDRIWADRPGPAPHALRPALQPAHLRSHRRLPGLQPDHARLRRRSDPQHRRGARTQRGELRGLRNDCAPLSRPMNGGQLAPITE